MLILTLGSSSDDEEEHHDATRSMESSTQFEWANLTPEIMTEQGREAKLLYAIHMLRDKAGDMIHHDTGQVLLGRYLADLGACLSDRQYLSLHN